MGEVRALVHSVFVIVVAPDIARTAVVTDIKHLPQVPPSSILFPTATGIQGVSLGIRVKFLPGPRSVSRAVEGKQQASRLPAGTGDLAIIVSSGFRRPLPQ